jgi:hypothetical protein
MRLPAAGPIHRYPFPSIKQGVYELDERDGSVPQRVEIKNVNGEMIIYLATSITVTCLTDLPLNATLREVSTLDPIPNIDPHSITRLYRRHKSADGPVYKYPFTDLPTGVYEVLDEVHGRKNFRIMFEGDTTYAGEETFMSNRSDYPMGVRLQSVI